MVFLSNPLKLPDLEKNSLSRLGILDIRLIQPRKGVLHPILIVAWEHFECPVYDFR